MEIRIWDDMHILVFQIEVEAENWLRAETIRINIDTQGQIDYIITISTEQITAVRIEWTLRVEQEINIIKINAQLEIDNARDYWHNWCVIEIRKLEDDAWNALAQAEVDINAEVTITIQRLHTEASFTIAEATRIIQE